MLYNKVRGQLNHLLDTESINHKELQDMDFHLFGMSSFCHRQGKAEVVLTTTPAHKLTKEKKLTN
jgi:hypothetical protein